MSNRHLADWEPAHKPVLFKKKMERHLMKEPGLLGSHCYSLLFSTQGTHAVALIRNFQPLSGDEAQEYAKELAFG